VEGAPTEEPRPGAQATRGTNDRPQGQLACPVLLPVSCVLNFRGCPQVFYTAPVIHPVRVHKYIPGRQVNAIWMGSIPHRMCNVCKKKELGVQSVLGARRQNLSRLRVEKLGRAGSRQVIPAVLYGDEVSADKSASISNQAGHRVPPPLTYLCVAPPGKSPAYTYLKQPWQPLQVFALSQSLFCILFQPILYLKQRLQPLQIFNQKI
jgi:hypothetical protein